MIYTALKDLHYIQCLYYVEWLVLHWVICVTLNDLYYVEWFVLRWVICTTFNAMCYVEWFVLPWMICTALNDMYNVEWFVLHWMICNYVEWFVLHSVICTMLNDLNYVEWFVQCWIICSTALNYLYYVEWFVRRWMIFYLLAKFVPPQMICTALKDLHYIEWFGVQWMICTTLNHLGFDELLRIVFLMSFRCVYLKKCCKVLFANLWVDFFLIWKYQEEIIFALPQKFVIWRCFWSLWWKLLLMYFPDIFFFLH